MGKERNPSLVLLFCVLTGGIYWFYWLFAAFGEVARRRQARLRAGWWVLLLAPAWLVIDAVKEQSQCAASSCGRFLAQPLMDRLLPTSLGHGLLLGLLASLLAYYGALQLLFLSQATDILIEAHPEARARLENAKTRIGLATVLFPLGYFWLAIPWPTTGMGSVALVVCLIHMLAAILLAAHWVERVQREINGFWQVQRLGLPIMAFTPTGQSSA